LSQAIQIFPFIFAAARTFFMNAVKKEQTLVRRVSESTLARVTGIAAFLLLLKSRGETMIKRLAALGLCLALLVLSSTLPVEGAKTFHLERGGNNNARGESSPFLRAQENNQSLLLPQSKGAWLISMSRDGGMRPRQHSVQINSNGEISVNTTRYTQGHLLTDCSMKAKLSAEDLLRLRESVRAARLSAWRERYEDPKHPICCDQPTTRITLQRREAGGAKQSYQTSWYPGSSQLRPADLARIATLTQTLWNKTNGRCVEQAHR
jgi:hypothetical protein